MKPRLQGYRIRGCREPTKSTQFQREKKQERQTSCKPRSKAEILAHHTPERKKMLEEAAETVSVLGSGDESPIGEAPIHKAPTPGKKKP